MRPREITKEESEMIGGRVAAQMRNHPSPQTKSAMAKIRRRRALAR